MAQATSTGMELNYSVTPTPFPLQASPKSGSPAIGSLTVVGTNPNADAGDHPVTLKGIAIQIPVGPDANDLTPDASTIQVVYPDGWNAPTVTNVTDKDGDAAVKYSFTPQPGHGSVGAEALLFVFNNIQVNDHIGTADLTITDSSQVSDTFPLTKVLNGWGSITFTVDQPVVKYGTNITLSWSGPQQATYSLKYWDYDQNQPAKVSDLPFKGQYPGQGQSPLVPKKPTVYTLSVDLTQLGVPYTAEDQLTVTVGPPPPPAPPKITHFSGTVQEKNGSNALVFSWQTDMTEGTGYCELSAAPDLELQPNSSPDGYRVEITAIQPLTSTYTLTAVRSDGAKSTPSTLNTTWSPIGSLPSPATNVAIMPMSPDGSKVYVANGYKISILVPTGDDRSPLKETDPLIDTTNEWGVVVAFQSLALSLDGTWLFAYGHTFHAGNKSPWRYAIFAGNVQTGDLRQLWLVSWQLDKPNPGDYPLLAASADGSRLYLAGFGTNTIQVFSFNSSNWDLSAFGTYGGVGSESGRIGAGVVALNNSYDGKYLYVLTRMPSTNGGYDFWIEAYTAANSASSPLQHVTSYRVIEGQPGSMGMCIAPRLPHPTMLYTLDANGKVWGVDTTSGFPNDTLTPYADVQLGAVLGGMVVAPSGLRVYACNVLNSTISSISLAPSLTGGT